MLTPTSQELQLKLNKLLADTPKELRYEWAIHPITKVISLLLETMRLRAFEAIEAGAYENEQQVAKLAGQCQLCTDLAAFFDEAIIIEEIDNDSD